MLTRMQERRNDRKQVIKDQPVQELNRLVDEYNSLEKQEGEDSLPQRIELLEKIFSLANLLKNLSANMAQTEGKAPDQSFAEVRAHAYTWRMQNDYREEKEKLGLKAKELYFGADSPNLKYLSSKRFAFLHPRLNAAFNKGIQRINLARTNEDKDKLINELGKLRALIKIILSENEEYLNERMKNYLRVLDLGAECYAKELLGIEFTLDASQSQIFSRPTTKEERSHLDETVDRLAKPEKCLLLKIKESPTEEEIAHLKEIKQSAYLISDKGLWYFNPLNSLIEEIPFNAEKAPESLLETLELKENRPVTEDDLALIATYTNHSPANPQQEELLINGFSFKFLGGRNNMNWLAEKTDPEDPEAKQRLAIRIEEAADINYELIAKLRFSPSHTYLAKDQFTYPLGRYNLVETEYCPKGNLGMAVRPKGHHFSPLEIEHRVVQRIRYLGGFLSSLMNQEIAYIDLKSENFLEREDGSLITGDFKSFKTTERGRIHINQARQMTPAYFPPEFYRRDLRDPPGSDYMNAEKLMVYDLGLMAYMLSRGFTTRVDLAEDRKAQERLQEEKRQTLETLYSRANSPDVGLNFEDPMFQTPHGKALRAFIESCIAVNPNERPSLRVALERLAELDLNLSLELNKLNQKEPEKIKEDIESIEISEGELRRIKAEPRPLYSSEMRVEAQERSSSFRAEMQNLRQSEHQSLKESLEELREASQAPKKEAPEEEASPSSPLSGLH